ncbi:DNA phosphorothioation-associated protein 4 [Nonomuraea turkmeniaca]|uniref:DNA phosphorothioation-associated protein 4 n=1 Tax=Nonomuraea turkmeniaca TaxID=103838 RepID=A0A5S4FPK6_9ACTN|nr:DNA phosphorothioation-associated protein 4 [Nonomuraea turkmeniaca]TMR22632.1 DNA phosphorothioation-associated protein 4 [Nonomuraea turkmeniaca]
MILEQRIRRPADKEELIARLAGEAPDALFASMRDLFVFAAALGKAEGKKVPLPGTKGDIRLELFQRDSGHELLIQVLSVLEHEDDLEILRDDRVAERVAIFEQYANGGLEIIQAHLNANRLAREDDAIQMLVNRHIEKHLAENGIDLTRFADELGL